jgi:hypothetical protein
MLVDQQLGARAQVQRGERIHAPGGDRHDAGLQRWMLTGSREVLLIQ